MTNEEIRRQLGTDLIEAEREQRAVVIGTAQQELLPKNVLYFDSFEAFEAWHDNQLSPPSVVSSLSR